MSKIVGVTVGTPLSLSRIKNEIEPVIEGHEKNKENPHGVTKDQVGLGNVDNTSDMDKPVSTAQAEAIADAKKAGTDAQTLANNAQAAAENAEKNAKDYADASVNDAVQEIKDTNYSVINKLTALAYSISLADKGLTILNNNTLTGDFVVTFDKSVSANFPLGAEIAILRSETNMLKVAFTGGMRIGMAGNDGWVDNPTISIPERFGMIALKKVGSSSSDYWVLTGNVEVV